MALAMKVISQVEAQRKILEEAVSTALELASGKSDGAEVAVSKTTGISVSTRYGEVENVEFNSDGALGITVYHQNRKGSASSTDLSPQAIARTVQAALDIARYTSPDPYAGVADKELLAFDAPDLDLFHPADVSPDEAIELAARAEQAALQADKRITNTEGGSQPLRCQSFWQQPRHVAGVLLYASFALQLCNRRRKWRYGARLCLHHWACDERSANARVGWGRLCAPYFIAPVTA